MTKGCGRSYLVAVVSVVALAVAMPAKEAVAVSACTADAFVLDDDGTNCSINTDATGGSNKIVSDITSITIQDTGAGAFGTLTLGGNTVTVGGANAFTLDAGATLNTTISSATAAGQVVATGAAPTVDAGTTLGITVTATDYIATGTTYTIVDVGAAGINAPGTVTDDSSVLSFAATVSSNDLIVTATRTPTYSNTAPSGGAAGASSALTSLSDAGATGDIQTVLQALDNLTGEAQGNAIATTIPQVNGGTSVAAISATTQTLGTVSTRLAELRSGLDVADRTGVSAGNHAKGIGVWIQGFSNFADQARRRQIEGFRASTWGAALGGDKTIGE